MGKRLLTILVILSVFLSVSACKSEQSPPTSASPTLVGSWTTQVEMMDTVNEMLLAQTGAYTVSTGFPVLLRLEFMQDGSYRLDFDRQQMETQLDSLGTVLWQMVVDQAAAQSGITTQEAVTALQTQGKSKELLMQQLNLESMFENSLCSTGAWKQEDGKLYMAASVEAFSEESAAVLQLEENLFTLTYTEAPAEEGQDPVQTVVTYTRAE